MEPAHVSTRIWIRAEICFFYILLRRVNYLVGQAAKVGSSGKRKSMCPVLKGTLKMIDH